MNILVLTNIYPLEKNSKKGLTPVVNYFCEEWVKQGHRVLVINNTSKFPPVFYCLPAFVAKAIENRVGFNLPNKFNNKKILIEENGVTVFQLPYSKIYPGQTITSNRLSFQFKEICSLLENQIFIPDVILGHWLNPQLQLIDLLKKRYKNAKTSLVLHSNLTNKELTILEEKIDCLDYVGFRNRAIKKDTESRIDLRRKDTFYCFSGVKDYYHIALKEFDFKHITFSPLNIVFVGNLIQRKYPHAILESVNKIADHSFNVNIVGEGPEMARLEKFRADRNIKVTLWGRLDRKEVYDVLEKSSIFIMISKNEAFGLVYLEAMLNRNIVIASRGDGFDGIIEDGVNGFLCNPGDSEELTQIIKKILNMPVQELERIQKKSFMTARDMTDSKMATRYIELFT